MARRQQKKAIETLRVDHANVKKGAPMQSGSTTSVDALLTPESLTKLYGQMLLIRRFEERAGQLYGQGLIGGFCHLYIGQEAIAVGAMAVKKPADTFVTAYRDHGHMLVTGMDPGHVMAELMGKRTGTSKGKGGSMHMFDPEKGFLGGHGIVGAQVPLGTGVAFSHQYKQDGGICMTFMGDGAANQGQVYEAMNMAALWNLPVLYVIENNGYAMGTSVPRACAKGDALYKRGEGWGIDGEKVDGMDLVAVIKAFAKAAAKVRAGKPHILEMDTYRYRGHSMSDPALYRSKDEVSDIKEKRDPIMLLKAYLTETCGIEEAALQAEDKAVKKRVLEAVTFAQQAPMPTTDDLYTDIVCDA